MRFKDFINEGKVRRANPDKLMAESIIKNTLEDFEEYKTDYKLRAIGERYFEKIIKNSLADKLSEAKEIIDKMKAMINEIKQKFLKK